MKAIALVQDDSWPHRIFLIPDEVLTEENMKRLRDLAEYYNQDVTPEVEIVPCATVESLEAAIKAANEG
jgi:hypothetical protein